MGESDEEISPEGTLPVKRGFPGVNPRVVGLWVGLVIVIAGLVVAADQLSRRDRRPTTQPDVTSLPAASGPASQSPPK